MPVEDGAAARVVAQLVDQPVGVEHGAVDAAVDPAADHPLEVGRRPDERVVVDRRDAEEGEQDAVRGQRLGRQDRGVARLVDRAQRVEVAEVELVDRAAAVRPAGPRDLAAVGAGALDQRRRARASSRMPSVARSPMPSWLARKLNQVAVSLTGPTPLAQSLQPGGRAGDERVQHQRRQRELVDEVGLVAAVAEVGDVLGVRHVGLGQQPGARARRGRPAPATA